MLGEVLAIIFRALVLGLLVGYIVFERMEDTNA